MKEEAAVYRPILKHAFQTAWFHRELWPLAAFAGLLGTGTIFNDLLTQAEKGLSLPKESAFEYFGLLQFIKVYFSYLLKADPTNAIGSFLLFAGVGILFLTIVIAAQHAILRTVHRASAKKAHIKATELVKEMRHPRFSHLILINLAFKLLIGNLLIATGLLIAELQINYVVADAFFGMIFAVTCIALAFTLNVIAMLSLIETTKHEEVTLFEALENAYKTFRAHPLVCLEMSAVLFGLNFLLTIGYVVTLILGAVPAILLFLTALKTGSTLLMSIGTSAVIFLFIVFSIAVAGFVTTFTYSAWMELSYKIARTKVVRPRLHLHGKRLLKHFAKS
jgi:hypothetical protein